MTSTPRLMPPLQDTPRPTYGRNPHLPPSLPWYHRADVETQLDEYAALSLDNQKRVDNLMSLASAASPRWIIQTDVATLLHRLQFKRESQFARFLVELEKRRLIYFLPDNAYLLAPVLFPFEADYPAPPSADESRENLKTHTLDSQAAQEELRLVMTPAERTAVSDMWRDYQQARAMCGYPVPNEADKGRYDAARDSFKQQFLERYRADMKPKRALAEILDLFERQLSYAAIADSHVRIDENEREILTIPYTTESENQRETETEEIESHNNPLNSDEIPRENANSHDDSNDAENVRNSEAFSVVVSLLCEKGAPTATGVTAHMARDTAVRIVEGYLAKGLNLESITYLVERQAEFLRFRRVTGSWDGMWITSVERNYSPPAEYEAYAREQKRQRQQAERVSVPRPAPISATDQVERAKVEAHLATLTPEERRALQCRAIEAAKDPIWAPRLKKHLEHAPVESLSPPAANRLVAFVTDLLRAESVI